MPIIKILPHPEYCPQGAQIEAPAGTTICEALLDNKINTEEDVTKYLDLTVVGVIPEYEGGKKK